MKARRRGGEFIFLILLLFILSLLVTQIVMAVRQNSYSSNTEADRTADNTPQQ